MLCVCIQSMDRKVCEHANRLGIVHKVCNIQISEVAVSLFVTNWQHCKHPNIRICCQCKTPVLIQELTNKMSVREINNNLKCTDNKVGYLNGNDKNSNFTMYIYIFKEGG